MQKIRGRIVMSSAGKLRIFISWSLPLSQQVAAILRDWFPRVIQNTDPWVSSEDIEKGTYWQQQVDEGLRGAEVGVIVVTPANSQRAWLNFEAGALTKTMSSNGGVVAPLLIDLDSTAISGPLTTLQLTPFEDVEVFKLLTAINARTSNPLSDTALREEFALKWPQLQARVAEAVAANPDQAKPESFDSEQALREIVTNVRAIARQTKSQNSEPLVELEGDSSAIWSGPPKTLSDIAHHFVVGARVRHPDLGGGTVVQASDEKIDVDFGPNVGTKRLSVRHVRPLLVLDD